MAADGGPQLKMEKATLSSFFRIRPRTFFPLASSTKTSTRVAPARQSHFLRALVSCFRHENVHVRNSSPYVHKPSRYDFL